MIEIINLDFNYKKRRKLFNALNLHLTGGNIYGLLGKNGMGKTTLLKIISGLLFPRQGTCRVLGSTPGKRSPALLSDIFFITEELYVPPLTIKEYEMLYSPFYPRFNAREFHNYLAEFNLPGMEKLSRLSLGQKKKFLLAFGLATNSRILLLDEPTNGLDIPGKSQFRKMLAAAINEERIFLVSTHQVRDMQQLIDPVIILSAGSILFQKSVAEINENLSIAFAREAPEPGAALFCEKVLGGYSVLSGCSAGSGAGIDLEMLFNAVIGNSAGINAAFKGGNQ